MEWPSQSPDLNIKDLWIDLKRAEHTRWAKNLKELEAIFGKKWVEVPQTRNELNIWLHKAFTSIHKHSHLLQGVSLSADGAGGQTFALDPFPFLIMKPWMEIEISLK